MSVGPIGQISMRARDIDRATAFYSQTLDLKIFNDSEGNTLALMSEVRG